MVETELLNVPLMYWVMSGIIFFISLFGAFMHKSFIPLVWGCILSGVLVLFVDYLAPTFNGFWVHGWTILGVLSLIFLGMWGLLVAQGLYNNVVYGRPWA